MSRWSATDPEQLLAETTAAFFDLAEAVKRAVLRINYNALIAAVAEVERAVEEVRAAAEDATEGLEPQYKRVDLKPKFDAELYKPPSTRINRDDSRHSFSERS